MFEVGDVVVCVEPRDHLILNREYKISYVQPGHIYKLIKLEEHEQLFFARRFRKVNKEQQKILKEKVKAVDISAFVIGDLFQINGITDQWVKYLEGRILPISYVDKNNVFFHKEEYGNYPIYISQCIPEKDLTFLNLYREAVNLQIPSRSLMNKAALLAAIKGFKGNREFVKKPGQTLGDRLIQKAKTQGVVTCASYAFAFVDGSEKINHYTACHAGFNYIDKPLAQVVENVCDKYETTAEAYKPIYRRFIDYMINRSPWKTAFIPCDVDVAINRGVYANIEEKLSNVVNALIALRQGHENRQILRSWKYLLDNGFDENTSWAASQFFLIDTNGMKFLHLPTGAHDWLTGAAVVVECYLEFFRNGFQFCKEEFPLKEGKRTYNVTKAITGFGQHERDKKGRQTINSWAVKHLPLKAEFSGWNEVKYLEDKTVLAFAKLIEEQIRVVK